MKKNMYAALAAAVLVMTGCTPETTIPTTGQHTMETEMDVTEEETSTISGGENTVMTKMPAPEQSKMETRIRAEGEILQDRIRTPEGYERVSADEGSFLSYMRQMKMKPDGSPVLLYDGREKGNQTAQAAVFAMPVFDSDLQQCADSIMRVYAEYFYSTGQSDKIAFHLTNGFMMDYPAWRDGNRLKVDGNKVSWVKKESYDDSYDTFLLYLKYVMMYAGTLSLSEESPAVELQQLQAGDMFLKGGSPGHCVMVADVAKDASGNLSFLLAQGYMPAQDFHILNNPLHEEDPWYYVSEVNYPLVTPEYVFQEGSFRRWYGFADRGEE